MIWCWVNKASELDKEKIQFCENNITKLQWTCVLLASDIPLLSPHQTYWALGKHSLIILSKLLRFCLWLSWNFRVVYWESILTLTCLATSLFRSCILYLAFDTANVLVLFRTPLQHAFTQYNYFVKQIGFIYLLTMKQSTNEPSLYYLVEQIVFIYL